MTVATSPLPSMAALPIDDIIIHTHNEWWPLAIGWWILLLLIIVSIIITVRRWYAYRNYSKIYRLCMSQITLVEKLLINHQIPPSEAVKIFDKLFKKFLVKYDKSQRSLSLTAENLQQWLNNNCQLDNSFLKLFFDESLYKNEAISHHQATQISKNLKPYLKRLLKDLKTKEGQS